MCKAHRKLYDKTLKIPSKIVPKSTLNRSRKPSKTALRKSMPQKHRKIEKSTENGRPKGGPRGGPRIWFSDIMGLLGAPGGPHGSHTSPRSPSDPSESSFLMILINFRMICEVFCIRLAHIFRSSLLLSLHLFCLRAHTPTTHDPRSSANVWARWRGWPAGHLDNN